MNLDEILDGYYYYDPVLKHCRLIDKKEAKQQIIKWALSKLPRKMTNIKCSLKCSECNKYDECDFADFNQAITQAEEGIKNV